MKISITVYDERYKKVFSVAKVELNAGMFQVSSFLQHKVGAPLKVVSTTGKANKCYICQKAIKKGQGMTYEGKQIHQACLAAARTRV